MSTPQTWLTQEAADRLRGELAHLESGGRKEITAKIGDTVSYTAPNGKEIKVEIQEATNY